MYILRYVHISVGMYVYQSHSCYANHTEKTMVQPALVKEIMPTLTRCKLYKNSYTSYPCTSFIIHTSGVTYQLGGGSVYLPV